MKKRLFTVIGAVFWIAVWQIAAMALNQPILLPSPLSVLRRLTEIVPTSDFLGSIGFSLSRILLGFVSGVAAGTLLAALSGRFTIARQLLAPLISVLKSIPVASFIILVLIWIGSRELSVLISFLVAVPIVYSNMLEGIDALDPKLIQMADIFEIPPMRRFVGVYLSQLLPYFRAASRLAMGLCWKSGIAAEVIGQPEGSIGDLLYYSKAYLETEDLFAWTLVIILMSVICEKLFGLLVDSIVKKVSEM